MMAVRGFLALRSFSSSIRKGRACMSWSAKRVGRTVGLGLFAGLFVLSGVGHFVSPEVYLRIMPPELPQPRALVAISGAAEVALGCLLMFRPTRKAAAWGLIALLIAVFPANIFMWRHADEFGLPPLALLLRLPLQGLLIFWAWTYTKAEQPRTDPKLSARSSLPATIMALWVSTCLLGCGFGGSRLARLDQGMVVSAQSTDGKPIPVFFAVGEETIEPGTVIKVISDDEGTTSQPDRKVVVGIQGGAHQGLAALMRRRDLQPGSR